jgi:hypothetical protein
VIATVSVLSVLLFVSLGVNVFLGILYGDLRRNSSLVVKSALELARKPAAPPPRWPPRRGNP